MEKRKHIELFAGCGGLNLGLETAGFELYFANEVSPMAGETFAYNFLKEDLAKLSSENKLPENVLWINSNHPKVNLKDRLRENPFKGEKKYTDLTDSTSLKYKLLLGDINKLLPYLRKNKRYKEIRDLNIDVLSGGPPCQGFSLAGKRKKDDKKNLLPLSFAKFSGLIKPKVVLLENVKGITSPFIVDNQNYYAWLEVSKAFVLEGYYPICMMINSKYFAVPQNRPRFILLAYRRDIFSKLKKKFKDNQSKEILENTNTFYSKVSKNKQNLDNITIADFKYFDIEKEQNLFNGVLLPKIETSDKDFITVEDAIDDLNTNREKSSFVNRLDYIFNNLENKEEKISNFEIRKHNNFTQARFRFYQILEQVPPSHKRELMNLLSKKTINSSIQELFIQIKDFNFLIPSGKKLENREQKLKKASDLITLTNSLYTKKHSQRSLSKNKPAPAQLTVPDDFCHYDFNTPRVLTVREMARIQSFPDWFEFKSKVTTGGDMRRYETPQYTQVGNAVPPILGWYLGNFIQELLNRIEE